MDPPIAFAIVSELSENFQRHLVHHPSLQQPHQHVNANSSDKAASSSIIPSCSASSEHVQKASDFLHYRLKFSPFITGIEAIDREIPKGLMAGDIVELYGGSESGKTMWSLSMAARCVLPRTYRGLEIGGEEMGVLWMDTDVRFVAAQFKAILEQQLHEVCVRHGWTTPVSVVEQIDDGSAPVPDKITFPGGVYAWDTLVRDCLSRIHVARCTSPMMLFSTLSLLNQQLSSPSASSSSSASASSASLSHNPYPRFRLVVLDSVSSFYYSEKYDADVQSSQVKSIPIKWYVVLRELIQNHHLICIATKSPIYKLPPCNVDDSELISAPKSFQQKRKGWGGQSGAEKEKSAATQLKPQMTVVQSFNARDFMPVDWTRMIRYRFALSKLTSPLRYACAADGVEGEEATEEQFRHVARLVFQKPASLVSSGVPPQESRTTQNVSLMTHPFEIHENRIYFGPPDDRLAQMMEASKQELSS